MALYDHVSHYFPGEVVLEDRLHLTLGARKRDVENRSFPVAIIVGDKVLCNNANTVIPHCSLIFVGGGKKTKIKTLNIFGHIIVS